MRLLATFKISGYEDGLAWELRTLYDKAQGDITDAGWLVITRVVHMGYTSCTKTAVRSLDETGCAHLGVCEL